MREIKFRAWDTERKTYDHEEILLAPNGDLLASRWQELCEPESVYIIEQCTGLKDKNGKEIYEGDILKFEDSIFEIGWLNKGARFGFCPVKNCNFGMGFSLSHSEVIGNIHENPELIGKEK